MMKHLKLLLLFLLFSGLVLFLSACSEDSDSPTEVEEDTDAWQEHDAFWGENKIIFNGYADEDNFTVAGLSHLTTFDNSSLNPVYQTLINTTREFDSKPALYGNIAVYEGNNGQLIINSAKSVFESGGLSGVLNFNELGLDYTPNAELAKRGYYTYPAGIFNENGLFFSAINGEGEYHGDNVSFCLIDFNFESVNGKLTYTPEAWKVNHENNGTASVGIIDIYNDYFFASVSDANGLKLYRIAADGSSTYIIDFPYSTLEDIFGYNGILYALTTWTNICCSYDDGLSWQQYGGYFPTRDARFFEINGTLCFYVYSQMGTLDIETGEIKEIVNTGLEGLAITSVNKFNDHVWVTTLSGLFYKHIDDFFVYKEVETSAKKESNFHNMQLISDQR